MVEAKGQRVRGRLYPWGIVEGESRHRAQHAGWERFPRVGTPPTACSCPAVENQAHCDFVKLRNMLIRTHMHDLKDVTCDVHYENYRAHCIQQMTRYIISPQT